MAERQPGLITETKLACIERDARAGLAGVGLSRAEAKQLTAALQAEIVLAQVAALGACPRACLACGRRLASKGYSQVRFRSLFGDVPVRIWRLLACPCQAGVSEAKSAASCSSCHYAFVPRGGTVPAFLDVRAAVLNDTLEDAFCRRHPGFRPANDDQRPIAEAA